MTNELTENSDLVCEKCGCKLTRQSHEEGLDFTFEFINDEKKHTCVRCKTELDLLCELDKLSKLNEKLKKNNCGQIYAKQEFDKILVNYTPTEIMLKITLGNFKPSDKYFEFDGYGNLLSYSNLEKILEIYNYL